MVMAQFDPQTDAYMLAVLPQSALPSPRPSSRPGAMLPLPCAKVEVGRRLVVVVVVVVVVFVVVGKTLPLPCVFRCPRG